MAGSDFALLLWGASPRAWTAHPFAWGVGFVVSLGVLLVVVVGAACVQWWSRR